MNLPHNTRSFIDAKKITDYLLSDTHERGKHKAKFFKAFGFTLENVEQFCEALLNHARVREVHSEKTTPFGKTYELQCDITTPDSRNPCIVSVWIIENDKTTPKLITAFPN